MGLRDICMTAAEQQSLANYMNAQLQQVSLIFLVIGFLVGLLAGAAYIWIDRHYGQTE